MRGEERREEKKELVERGTEEGYNRKHGERFKVEETRDAKYSWRGRLDFLRIDIAIFPSVVYRSEHRRPKVK